MTAKIQSSVISRSPKKHKKNSSRNTEYDNKSGLNTNKTSTDIQFETIHSINPPTAPCTNNL